MGLAQITETIKDYGRDIRLNLSSVLTEEGAPGLTLEQIWSVALSCAYATKTQTLIDSITEESESKLNPAHIEAAKAAATIMAMNNVYYRFLYLSENKEFATMPARLRMSVIGKPGVDKKDFELMCLAVSAIAGCGSCVKSHVAEVQKAGISNEGVQSSIRIASVIQAAAQALSIG